MSSWSADSEVHLISLLRTPFDAPEFIERVERLILGAAALASSLSLHIVQVDDWFDSKWLGFSGKTLGAVGVADTDLTVPPFHPNRVLRETRYSRHVNDDRYAPDAAAGGLHLHQASERNLRRYLRLVAPGTICFWYTSESARVQRGAVMTYTPAETGYWVWYAAFAHDEPAWRVTRRKGISLAELTRLEEVGARAAAS